MATETTHEIMLTLGPEGQVVIPQPILAHHGLAPGAQLRLVETDSAILLLLNGSGPMDPALAAELAEWQNLFAESQSLYDFEYDWQDDQSPKPT